VADRRSLERSESDERAGSARCERSERLDAERVADRRSLERSESDERVSGERSEPRVGRPPAARTGEARESGVNREQGGQREPRGRRASDRR
jgi:hypothetical protein